jgi:hypothetical protein
MSQLSSLTCPVPSDYARPSAPVTLSTALLTPLFGYCCHVLACPFYPDQDHLSRLTCQVDLSKLTFPSCLVYWSCPKSFILQISCHGGRIIVVLSLLSCHCCHILVVVSSASYPGYTIPSVFSGCPALADLSRFSCLGCSAPAVLAQLSCPSCPVPAILSQLSCFSTLVPSSPAPLVVSWLSCPSQPVLSVMSRLTCQANLSMLICLE